MLNLIWNSKFHIHVKTKETSNEKILKMEKGREKVKKQDGMRW